MRHHWGFVAVLLAGCTDEVSIAPNTCGNDVLETGEDCDQPGSGCTTECRIACDPQHRESVCSGGTLDGTCCPSETTCGVDRVCHATTGTFEATPTSSPFNAAGFILADLDGDLAADALGTTSGVVTVSHGGTRPFSSSTEHPAPFTTGPISLGDFTGDGLPDVMFPTVGGIAAFTTTSGDAVPMTFPVEVSDPGTIHERGVYFDNQFVQVDMTNGATPGFQLSSGGAGGVFPCGELFSTPKGRALHPYLDVTQVRVPIMVTGAKEATMPTKSVAAGVCIDSPGAASGSQRIPIGPLGNTLSDGETFFVNLPGTGSLCPSLVIPLTVAGVGEAAVIAPGSGAPGSCSVATPQILGAGQNSVVVPGIPFLAVQLATTPAAIGIVTSTGIYTVDMASKTRTAVAGSTRDWRYGVATDLDGDGLQDLAVIATTEDIEVFMQRASTTQNPKWRTVVVPTALPVQTLDVGDLDGDGVPDLAYAMLDGTDAHNGDVQVAFGDAPGAFSAPVDVATLPELDYIVVRDAQDPSLPAGFDNTDNIFVAHGGDDLTTEHAEFTYLYGSGSRTLFAPWAATTAPYTYGAGVATGNFGPGGTLGALALFLNPAAPPSSANSTKFLPSALTLNDTGTFDVTQQTLVTGCGGSANFCAPTAKYAVWPRSTAAGGDVLIGLRTDRPAAADVAPACGAYYTAAAATLAPIACSDMFVQDAFFTQHASSLTGISGVKMLEHADDSAVVAISSNNTKLAYSTLVFTVNMQSTGPQLSSGIDLSAEVKAYTNAATVVCEDVAVLDLGTRTVDGVTYGNGKEFAVACFADGTNAIFGRFAAADGGPPHYETLVPSIDVAAKAFLRAGDVDGDGLADLVYLAGSSIFVHRQCDAHDTACQGGK
jgi:hypothetical protein